VIICIDDIDDYAGEMFLQTNMRPIVKICGLTRLDDALLCARYGADILGFVVGYPRPVPWNISVSTAKELIAAVPPTVKTCVVTGGTAERILNLAREIRPNYVQLHYGESLTDTKRLLSELGGDGIQIIKTLFPDTPELVSAGAKFCAAGVSALLLDPRTPNNAVAGGAADLSSYLKLCGAVDCPVILAGGITPENAAGIVRQVNPPMIDVMTGVERSPGYKDEYKVKALFGELRHVGDSTFAQPI